MRIAVILHPLLVLVLVFSVQAASQRPDQMTFPPLEIIFPEISQQQTDNGMNVYLKVDDELPLVDLTLMVRGGSIHDPVEKTGLSQWFAQALETGGSASLTPMQLEEELDRMAAQLTVTSSSYSYQIDLSVHQRDLSRGLEILTDLLRRPRFDTDRVELARHHLLEDLHRKNDNPAAIAGRYLASAVNPDHPFGLEPTLEGINSLAAADLVTVHQRFFHPENLWWGVSGAIDEQSFLAELNLLLGDWTSDRVDVPGIPALSDSVAARVHLIDRKLSQTTLLMGHRGISKDNPDMHAVRLANYILGGGGFNSRMMREIRSNRGLAYSIYSMLQPGRYLPELFVVSGETRNDSAVEVVKLVQKLIEEFISQPVPAEELESAKNSLINSFIFAFEDTHAVVTQKMRLDFYDYPADYLETYQERLEELTPVEIQRVAKLYLQPENLHIVLVGDSDILVPHIEGLGYDIEVIMLNQSE